MSNGTDQQYNCILQICCGGDHGAKQKHALAEMISHTLNQPLDPSTLTAVVGFVVEHFDLTKKGLLQPLIDETARLARGFPYDG